jgi:hypothetical protein
MSKLALITLEGSYLYYQNDVNYSQENFKLVHFPENQTYHIYSEILSRTESGEFLKIMVRYEMNSQFIPVFVRIEKSLGNRYAQEIFSIDIPNLELHYTFQDSQSMQEVKKPYNARHYLATPAFSTSTIFTLSKKFDPNARTPVTFIGSNNEWNFSERPEEKTAFAEFKSRDVQDFKINNAALPASHLCLYEFDSTAAKNEVPTEIYISKYFGIPYQLIQGENKILIKNLKKNS